MRTQTRMTARSRNTRLILASLLLLEADNFDLGRFLIEMGENERKLRAEWKVRLCKNYS